MDTCFCHLPSPSSTIGYPCCNLIDISSSASLPMLVPCRPYPHPSPQLFAVTVAQTSAKPSYFTAAPTRPSLTNHFLSRVCLVQLVKFLVVKLTHTYLNTRFDMSIVFTANYFFSGRRRPRRQRDTLDDRLCESQDQTDSVFQRCSYE
jgi:hypothetical protein